MKKKKKKKRHFAIKYYLTTHLNIIFNTSYTYLDFTYLRDMKFKLFFIFCSLVWEHISTMVLIKQNMKGEKKYLNMMR